MVSGRSLPARPSSASSSSKMSCARTNPEGECVVLLPKYEHTGPPSPSSSRDARSTVIDAAAPASFASRARSDGAAASSAVTRSLASAPTACSAATSASAERWLTSSSPSGLSPTSTAMTRPSIGPRDAWSSSRSRTRAREGTASSGRMRRRIAERVWPDDAVRLVADVPLEEPKRGVRPRAVESVLLAAVETEGVQHPLELANVVASEHGCAVIQRAIAELPSSLDELLPGVGSDEPVDPKVTLPLEPRDGRLRSRGRTSRRARRRPRRRRATAASTWMSVIFRTSIARTIDAHRSESAVTRDATATAAAPCVGKWPYARCGSRSRRMASLGRAPVTLTTSLPALNRISEGIDITP